MCEENGDQCFLGDKMPQLKCQNKNPGLRAMSLTTWPKNPKQTDAPQ